MASFTSLRPETVADQRLYLDGRLVEVSCLDCLAKVRVKKNSPHHTSIQWSKEAVNACAEFARVASEAGDRVVCASCPRLKQSIDDAVEEGQLPMGDGPMGDWADG